MLGAGAANGAPPFYGETYAKASESVKSNGGTPMIATIIGSQLPTNDCVVTNAYPSITLNSQGRAAHGSRWLFELNCNQRIASPGKPGNSAATADGSQAKKIEGYIEYWNKGNFDACGADKKTAQWCQQECDAYGGCSAEFENYLASKA
ncbi:hypothetical protein [Mycobacterium sp. DL592]|uniref:hypothetical protein n=1 Tax=Mycobacterium sp. DL592 TaxID=2675524 RepID=UPI001423BA34|nr:hypothetical protein [Mycobacterium sp. DL592]